MNRFDLMPSDYKQFLWLNRYLQYCMKFLIAFIAIGGIAVLILTTAITQKKSHIGELQQTIQSLSAQQLRVNELRIKKQQLKSKIDFLSALYAGPKPSYLIQVLDNSLDNQVWLTTINFRRFLNFSLEQESGSDQGALKVPGKNTLGESGEWLFTARLQLTGQAIDHTALSEFVNKLQKQQDIRAVTIASSGLRQQANEEVIEFDLLVDVQHRKLNT